MEIRNHSTDMTLTEPMKNVLDRFRAERGFNVQYIVERKVELLNSYYQQANLSAAVVAVSGGIDSSVVLGLVVRASKMPNSPIKRIVAITMPDQSNVGVTGQIEAADLASQVCWAFGVQPLTLNMDSITKSIIGEVEFHLGEPDTDKALWCRGQVTSYARTPTYYYVTSVLASQGTPGLVVGTTNLSEGGYLGYFGKASDGMVDLQLISDLFKNEVYEVGEYLGVPSEILTRPPTGDMWDATTDEVVFGAPYDAVEIFLHGKMDHIKQAIIDRELGGRWIEYRDNLNRMHEYNAHKYLGKSPAVHLDIMPCGVMGGWNNDAWRVK